jgi:hypothetical protein
LITLKVSLNDEPLTTAGRDDLSALNVVLGACGKISSAAESIPNSDDGTEILLHVGGLTVESEEKPRASLTWIEGEKIKAGDVVSLHFEEAESADPPASSSTLYYGEDELKEKWESAREYYLHYKDRFESE